MATSPSPQQPSTSSASSSRAAPSAVPAKLKWSLDDKLKLAYAVFFTQTLEFEDGSPPENDWDSIASTLQEPLDGWSSTSTSTNPKKKKKFSASDLNEKYSKENCILQYQKLEEETLATRTGASLGRKFDPSDLPGYIVEKLNKDKRAELAVRLARDKKNLFDMLQENKKYEMTSQGGKLNNDEMIKLMDSTKDDVKRLLTKEEIKNFHKKDESESDMSDLDDEELMALNFDVDTFKNFPKLQAKSRPEANELSVILDKLGCFNSDDDDDDDDDSDSDSDDDKVNFKDAESSPSSSPKKLSTSSTSSPSAVSPGLIRLQLVNPFNVSDPKDTQTSPSKNEMSLETQAKEKETDQPLTKIAKTLNFDEMEELEETERDLSPEREIIRSERVSTEQVGSNKNQENESIFIESITPKKSEGTEQEIELYETPVGPSPAIKVYYYSHTDENKLQPKENDTDDIELFDDEVNRQEKTPEDVDIESKTNDQESFRDVESVTPKKSQGAEQEQEEYETPIGSSPAVKLYSKPDENKLTTTTKDIEIESVDDEIERQEKTPVESLVKESLKNSSVMPLQIEIGSKTNDEGKDKQNVDEIRRVTRAQAKIAPISTSDKSHISTIQPNDNQSEGEGQETSVMHQQGVKKMKIGTGNKSDDEVKEKDQIEEEKRITRARANVSTASSPRTPTYTMSPSLLDQYQPEHTPTPAAEEHQDYIGIIPSRTRSRVGVSPLTVFDALPPVMGQHALDSNPSSPSSTTTAFSLSNTEDERDHKVFKKQCSLFLGHIAAHKNASIFLKPITDESVEGYTECVKKPMDLSTIRKNIENGKIRKLADFERHLSLMFLNSLIFNASNRLICKMTDEMLTDTRKIVECFKLSLNECQNQKEKERSSPPLLRRKVTISESSSKTLHDSEAAESENDKLKKGGGRSRKGLKRPAPTPIDSGIERRRTRNQAMAMKKDGRISPDITTKKKKD